VDGRDQLCACLAWLLVLVGFLLYAVFVVHNKYELRRNPPISTTMLTERDFSRGQVPDFRRPLTTVSQSGVAIGVRRWWSVCASSSLLLHTHTHTHR
jgi:hypothetical protein